jgi:hypothetical protein
MGLMAPGTVFAGHRIEALVGRGGMGVVYRARQLDLDRVVALKVIAPELLEDPEMRERFVGEARTAAAIEHPNVIPLHYVGEEDGMAFLAMRFVDGVDVGALVKASGPMPAARATAIAAQAGAALDAIHAAGLVHRDVKPGNIMLTDDEHVYVTDFGLAKHALGRAGVTRSGQWVGTLDYVAPEQIRGGRIDARADIYALGGVLYFMLTAHVPFERDGDEARLWAHLTEPPPRASRTARGVPRALDGVVERALAKQPTARFPSAGDLGRAARGAVGTEVPPEPERMVARGAASPEGARREPGLAEEVPTLSRRLPKPEEPSEPYPGRRVAPVVAAVAAMAVLGAGAVVGVLLLSRGDDNQPADLAATGRAPPAVAPSSTPTPSPSATPAAVKVGRTIRGVTYRPNGVAVTGRDIWVTSYYRSHLVHLDAKTGRRRVAKPYVGFGILDIAHGPGGLWVAVYFDHRVVRVDPHTGRILRSIATPLPPVALAVGPSDVWVVGRAPANGAADALLHYDKDGRLLKRQDVAAAIKSITLGGRTLWVAEQREPRLLRVDTRTGQMRRSVRIGAPGFALAYGAGYLWASLRGKDEVTRVNPATDQVVVSGAGHAPEQLVMAGGHLFVASKHDHAVTVIDPETLAHAVRPLRVPFSPYALATTNGHVWVTNLDAGAVTRLDYRWKGGA